MGNMIVYDKHKNIQLDMRCIYREINDLKLPVDIYNPKIINKKNDYDIICIHGGGWSTGITKDSDWRGGTKNGNQKCIKPKGCKKL